MLIGVPKEIKPDEYRVGLIPSTVAELVRDGHAVAIEAKTGEGAGIGDDEYAAAEAELVATADQILGLRGIEWVNFGGGSAKNLCIG